MLRSMLIGRCSTVYKIDYSDGMEKPDALPNRKLLNYKDSQVKHCHVPTTLVSQKGVWTKPLCGGRFRVREGSGIRYSRVRP